jgi:phytoene dehydrogenase-like protein
MQELDYVVVGSGLAALCFAALMARSGRRVLVLEAHDSAGGYGHTFGVGGYRFNAQLHYVWNTAPDRSVGRVLRKLGIADVVPFVPLDPLGYDHMRIPGHALDVPTDRLELARRICAQFPESSGHIEAFLKEVWLTDEGLEALPQRVDGLHPRRALGYLAVLRNRDATLQAVFDRFSLPIEAQALLALQWPDFLLPPSQLSFLAWVKLFGGYGRGASYPKHHFESVVQALVGVIVACGGEVRLQRKVSRFLFDGARVSGVRAEVTDAAGVGTGVFEDVRAAEVVCNMDPRQAAEQIGLERFPPRFRARLQYTYAPSSFVAYCGVKDLDLRAYGFGAWNVFHADGPDLNAIYEAMYERGDYARVSFAMSTPTLISGEPGAAPEGHQILQLLTVANYDRFLESHLDQPKAYREQKQRIFDAMIDVIDRQYVPGIRDHLTVHVTGSPTTSARYARAPAGNSYGSAMTPGQVSRNRLDHRSGVPGLWFCNASSGFAGFAGTFWTGARLYERLTNDAILA